jgi:hypothetical protein
MQQNTLHPSEVAKVILQAALSDNRDFRYAVGKDATMILEARRNMSDREFVSFIKKQLNLRNLLDNTISTMLNRIHLIKKIEHAIQSAS